MDKFNKQIALKYVECVLGINDSEIKFQTNKFNLLSEIVQKLHHHLPFHNTMLVKHEPDARRIPCMDENIQWMLDGVGGLCWTNNTSVYMLLNALGYKAHLALSNVQLTVVQEMPNHVLIIVNDLLTVGDSYLVDVGFGYPTFKPISLDFGITGESAEITESFRTYKYVQKGQEIVRLHKMNDDSVKYAQCMGDFGVAYKFERSFVDIDTVKDMLTKSVYKNPNGPFNKSVTILRFIDSKFVGVKGNVFLKENDAGKLDATNVETEQQFVTLCKEYFPTIKTDDILQVLSVIGIFNQFK